LRRISSRPPGAWSSLLVDVDPMDRLPTKGYCFGALRHNPRVLHSIFRKSEILWFPAVLG